MTGLTLRRAAPFLLTAFAPVLLATGLAGHLFSATPRDAVPVIDDEIAYWNQMAAFAEAGMKGGYHTVNEEPSRSGFSRFGPHGPAFPIVYGSLGRVFGWRPYSAALISMVLVTIAAACWCRAARCGWWGVLALGTYWPLILFLPTAMQEPLHCAIALGIAAALGPRLPDRSKPAGLGLVTACLIAGLVRPTWALVAIPLAWFATRTRSRAARIVAIGACTAAAFVVSVVFGWLAAPYPGALLTRPATNASTLLGQVAHRAAINVYAFVVPVNADPIEVLVRYEVLVVLVASAVAAWRLPRDRAAREILVLVVLGLTLAAVIAGGSVEHWRDFRVMTPVLLLAVLIWLPGGTVAPRALVAANVIAFPLALASFQHLHAARFAPPIKTEHFARSIANVLSFRPGTDGWQNTVLTHVDAVDPALVALPHGIALSVTFAWEDITLPPRSRYLLLRSRDVDELSGRVPMRLIATTPIGRLYENVMVQSPR